MTKYIFVTGGVVSGIGKGICSASIGRLLIDRGYSVFMQKFDPYLNTDPGLLSPYQHGEVFVTRDGAKADLDLGHYERFIDVELTKKSTVTSGRIYDSVLRKEKRGDYNGGTVQVIPHVTDEIKKGVYEAAKESEADVIITEIGGTVGDIESLPFIEAIRQIHSENSSGDVLFVHTTLIPNIPGTDELKTKPTQHSYKELMSYGIKPDIIIARAEGIVDQETKNKISLFCDIPPEAIIQSTNVKLIYEVPLVFKRQNLDKYIIKKLGLEDNDEISNEWEEMVVRYKNANLPLSIGLVGKYTALPDSYLSVMNALKDAGYDNGYNAEITLVNSEDLNEENYIEILKDFDGIIVPGGSGKRGNSGIILAAKYAREENIPFYGIDLGMNLAVVEFARNILGLEEANSTEIDINTKDPVIYDPNFEDNQTGEVKKRIGNYKVILNEDTLAKELYEEDEVLERHIHNLEFNKDYLDRFIEAGFIVSGYNDEEDLVEILELKDNDYYILTTFDSAFRNRPNRPHPLYKGFIKAAAKKRAN